MSGVCVVASFMYDLVATAPRRPASGETLIGTSFATYVGGKGFNQAVAAARAGAKTAVVGRVGEDSFGAEFHAVLAAEGIDANHLLTDAQHGTGVGLPVVEDSGQNSIIVIPRANQAVTVEDVEAARAAIERSAVLLLQLELPEAPIVHAARIAHEAGATVVLNPAPFAVLPAEIRAYVDVLVPNEGELRGLAGDGSGGRATEGTGAECARDLGVGWKVSPSVRIAAGETFDLARIEGQGRITHIWLTTHTDNWRRLLLRVYWDGADSPAVEVPVGDFFGQGWGRFAQLSSQMVAVNPHGGFNSYWPMPFSDGAHLSVENLSDSDVVVYYQVTYEEGVDTAGTGRFHAQWRRSNPLADATTHVLLDGVRGKGQYVGTYVAWGVNSTGWWGEGEIKFYLDGDGTAAERFPTICGTGTEDYFGGAWNFDVPGQGYTAFTTPYLGLHQVLRPDGLYDSQQRFGMYRWHVPDPNHFDTDLTVDIQALGWRAGGRYLPLHDDIASAAFFYLDAPTTGLPPTPSVDDLEVL